MQIFHCFAFGLMWVFLGCTKPEENFIRIPSEFQVSVAEAVLEDGSRSLYLDLASISATYCLGDSLVYNTASNGFDFNVSVLESFKANECLSKRFSLDCRIQLKGFSDSMVLHIAFGKATTALLLLTDNRDFYKLELIDGTGLTLKTPQTRKIPDKLLWGYAYVKSTDPANEQLLTKLVKEIEYDCTTHWLPEGFYSYFYLGAGNSITWVEDPGLAGGYRNFYYSYSWNEVELDQFFHSLAESYERLIGFHIWTSDGKVFVLK